MNRHLTLRRARQQKFEFAGIDLWERLPQEIQQQCQETISRILVEAIHHQQNERMEDERQDSL